MKNLWTYIDNQNWRADTKYHAVLLLLGIVSALAGLTAWSVVRLMALSTVDWMICFIGYPVVISWFVVYSYSCGREFRNGRPCE